MSFNGWKYGFVSALSLVAATASADPPASANQGRKAPATEGSAAHPGASRDVEHGDHAERRAGRAAAPGDAPGEHPGRAEEHREARPGDPPRAAVEALMKEQLLSEEQAIAHLRAQGVHGAGDAVTAEPRDVALRARLRGERAKELRGRLRGRGISTQVRVELKTHARRLAQIERIRALTTADATLTTRIDAMLVRENERHARRMTRLIDEANQAPAGQGVTP